MKRIEVLASAWLASIVIAAIAMAIFAVVIEHAGIRECFLAGCLGAMLGGGGMLLPLALIGVIWWGAIRQRDISPSAEMSATKISFHTENSMP